MENMLGSVGKSVTDFAPISGESITDLGKSVTDFEEICPRVWGNLPQILRKSVTDFGEICHRLWGNPSPTLGKPATDFGKLRFQEKSPFLVIFLGKTCSVFGKTCFVVGQNMFCLGGKHSPFWRRTGSVFGTKLLRFGEKPARFGGNWFAFGIGLGLKSHCFEHKACFGLDF